MNQSPTRDEANSVLDEVTAFSRFVKRSRSNDFLRVTESSSPVSLSSLTRSKSSSSRYNLRRSFSAGQSPHSQSQMTSPPSSKAPSYSSSPPRDSSRTDLSPPVPSKDLGPLILSRWRFFPFLNREVPETLIEPDDPIPDLASPKTGDVICLSYNTLDDRGMRRLEGRSDHRPVIGSYAVYL